MSSEILPDNDTNIAPCTRSLQEDYYEDGANAVGVCDNSSIDHENYDTTARRKTIASFYSGGTRRGSTGSADGAPSQNGFTRRGSLRTISSDVSTSITSGLGGADTGNESSKRSLLSIEYIPRRRSLDLNGSCKSTGSSTQTLMVSFTRLNEQELTHLRKWNRRLHRTEVFDKYYFPAQWESAEMEAITNILKLEDPSSASRPGKELAGSGRGVGRRGRDNSMRSSGIAKGGSRLKGSRRATTAGVGNWSGNWSNHSSGNSFSSDFSARSSITNSFSLGLGDSAGKLTKLLTDPTNNKLDPAKATKQALEFLFFPYVHDPKSVLLKRGSVFLHDNSLANERELMIFTHGFVLADIIVDDAFRVFLALCDREFLTQKSFLDHLQYKFKELDIDETGEIKRWEIQRLLFDMGVPMAESVLDELICKCGQHRGNECPPNTNWMPSDNDNVNWGTLHRLIARCTVQQNNNGSIPSSNSLDRLDDSGTDRDGGGTGLKKLLGAAFSKVKKTTKAQCAALFSNVSRIDSLNICNGDDSASREISNSTYSHTTFSITLNGRPNDPLIFVCSKPEHRDSWIEALKPGVIRALIQSSDNDMVALREKIGWQHLVIRSSLMSLIILNDSISLECACQGDEADEDREKQRRSNLKVRMELNLLDEYNGYSPLHYASILGHTECMVVLLEAGSKVTLEDRMGLSPMYHALKARNDEVANVLEKYGADRNDDLRKLIQCEIDEQQNMENNDAANEDEGGRLETCAEALDSSHASEDIDDLLLKAVTQLG